MTIAVRKTSHYPALDGLRGIAALAVAAYHVEIYFGVGPWASHAYLAVDFFFMLSGFVIAYAYDRRLAAGLGLGPFLIIRLIRLYPLILLGIALGTTVLLISIKFNSGLTISSIASAAITNAALLPTPALLYARPYGFPVNSPLWSLCFEIWINIVYAALFPFLKKPLLWALLIIGAALTFITAVSHGTLNIGFYWNDFYLGLVRVLFPFTAGLLLARLYSKPTATTAWGHLAGLPLFIILAAPPLLAGYYDGIAVLLCFPFIVTAALYAKPIPKLDQLWRTLGNLSYPLYILHFPIVVAVSIFVHRHHTTGIKLYAAAITTYASILILAALAGKFYDEPVRQALSQQLNRKQAVLF